MAVKPRIGLVLGDPTGIGTEVVAKLLALPETSAQADILVIGDRRLYRRGVEIAGTVDADPQFLEFCVPRVIIYWVKSVPKPASTFWVVCEEPSKPGRLGRSTPLSSLLSTSKR